MKYPSYPIVKCGACGAFYRDNPANAAAVNHQCGEERVPLHVYPMGDTIDHNTRGGVCICGPRIEEGGLLIVHHSLDGRETKEQGRP